jgi:hypothetical protein
MESLTNKEKALLTYKLLKKRKMKREKEKQILLGEYFMDRYNHYCKQAYKYHKFKMCKKSN